MRPQRMPKCEVIRAGAGQTGPGGAAAREPRRPAGRGRRMLRGERRALRSSRSSPPRPPARSPVSHASRPRRSARRGSSRIVRLRRCWFVASSTFDLLDEQSAAAAAAPARPPSSCVRSRRHVALRVGEVRTAAGRRRRSAAARCRARNRVHDAAAAEHDLDRLGLARAVHRHQPLGRDLRARAARSPPALGQAQFGLLAAAAAARRGRRRAGASRVRSPSSRPRAPPAAAQGVESPRCPRQSPPGTPFRSAARVSSSRRAPPAAARRRAASARPRSARRVPAL